MREHNIGVRVRDATSDTVITIATIQPSCPNMIPAIPDVIIVKGRNTARIVRVDAMTARATSLVASTAACFGELSALAAG